MSIDRRIDPETLTMYERLSHSAGLVKVFDGREWLDLRSVVKEIIAALRSAYEQIEVLEAAGETHEGEIALLLDSLDAAHAEVSMLGALLRGDDA